MKIHLIRHGKAQRPFTGSDFNKSLNAKGKKQTSHLGKYLAEKNIRGHIHCSSAKRTRETLENICVSTHWENVTFIESLYLCSAHELLKHISQYNENDELIIVGHNFGLSEIVSYYTDEEITLRTGEYCCIDFGNLKLSESSRSTGIICDRFRYPC